MKSLHNTTSNGASKNVKDIQFWGDGDTFKLISKASSEAEGWMKSTKAMEIPGVGCVVQVTTQQRCGHAAHNLHVVAEALTFVPGVKIEESSSIVNEEGESGTVSVDGAIVSRKLVAIQ